MDKIRGFELISPYQHKLDFKELKDLSFTISEIKLPKRGTSGSAGYDCYSPITFSLNPGEEIKIPTGIKAYMQDGEVLKAYPRSGHGFKFYLRLANTVGIIDKDYYNNSGNEGHIFVKLRNEGTKTCTINAGEGMCQLMFEKFLLADGDSFTGEVREGGFGSTNK
jgi:dUTP pyrophosphatase